MARQRPSVFVGSSAEGLNIAKSIQILLDHSCEVTIWSQGVFGLSSGTLESLVNAVDGFDFAVLALTPDDLETSRGVTRPVSRDNVLFELGLFIGALGRERTFLIYDRTQDLKLPSDLAGITPATFEPHSTGNLQAALGAPCGLIEATIARLGFRENEELKHLSETAHDLELTGAKVQDLIRLLARSREVELKIFAKQFGSLISEAHLSQIQADLEDLQNELRKWSQPKKAESGSGLSIHSAKYGAEGKFADVTDRIRARVVDGRLDVFVTNRNLSADPIVGHRKYLEVDYEVDGERKTKKASEDETLSIP